MTLMLKLFVFVFFGPAAVCGTYYVQALSLTATAAAASVGPGLLITAILVVNNLRDIDTDRAAGKRTLAVRLGAAGAVADFQLLVGGAYLAALLVPAAGAGGLLPLLTLPLALSLAVTVSRDFRDGPAMNAALAGTARLTLAYCSLLGAGLLL